MTPYIVYIVTTAIVVLLAKWTPDPGSPLSTLRGYFLILLGSMVLYFGVKWVLPRIGHPELAFGQGLLLALLGAGTAIAALTRFPPYWEVASVWTLFRDMSEGVRQTVLVLAGLALCIAGLAALGPSRQAYLDCGHQLSLAANSHDTLAVLRRVPDPSLRPYSDGPAYSCERLLRAR